MSKAYTFEISTPPPSVNAMWQPRGRENILTPEGRAWKRLAALELIPQCGFPRDDKGKALPCFWSAIVFVTGYESKVDLDNYLKGIFDALGDANLTPNDRHIVKISVEFAVNDGVVVQAQQEPFDKWATIKGTKAHTKRIMKPAYAP